MKILYITLRDFPRRVANRIQTIKMADALANLCDLTLVVTRLHLSKADLFKHYGVSSEFGIRQLGEPKFGPLTLGLFPRILRTIFAVRPDFIIIREEYPAWILCHLFRNVVYEMHDFNSKKSWLYKKIILRSCLTVVVTRALVAKCELNGIPVSKIVVLPDGVDLKLFQVRFERQLARSLLSLPINDGLVVYAGRLSAWKGIYTLIDSIKYVERKVTVVMLGGFEGERAVVQNYVDQAGLSGRIILCGHKDHKDVPLYLQAADILAIPNSGVTELSRDFTSPLKLFEYMASNRPIIASDLPSIREVLDENTAFLFRPDSPLQLANGITKLVNDAELAARLSENAFKLVHQFSWSERARGLIDLLSNQAPGESAVG